MDGFRTYPEPSPSEFRIFLFFFGILHLRLIRGIVGGFTFASRTLSECVIGPLLLRMAEGDLELTQIEWGRRVEMGKWTEQRKDKGGRSSGERKVDTIYSITCGC